MHNDLLGSPVRSTNANSSVNFKEDYTPFGEKRLDPAANKDDVGFTGHVQDDATGLTYMQARYYDPNIGRFLSIDPVGFVVENPSNFNRYAYVSNNPYRYTDPSGKYRRGEGFSHKQWRRFKKAQRTAGSKMTRAAEKLNKQAAAIEKVGGEGSSALRERAEALSQGATILQDTSSDSKYVANGLSATAYAEKTKGGTGAAAVSDNGPVANVNLGNDVWKDGFELDGAIQATGHESLHSAGYSDQYGSNGKVGYSNSGNVENRAAFDELTDTPAAAGNPDHILEDIL